MQKSDPEVAVSRYFRDCVERGNAAGVFMMRWPGKTLRMLIALGRLPCLRVVPSAAVEGEAIRALLLRYSSLWRVTGLATAVLSLPHEADQYSLGASKQTLRRKVRQATRLGIHWAEVSDPQERWDLLQLANERERTHPDVTYRNADPDNLALLGYRLWLVARAADGRPLLLSVTLMDGELALLRYFRTLDTGIEQSNARYLMTEVLVRHLVRLGVRYLVDGSNQFWLPSGLRHFQRMVGFRIVRIRIARPGVRGVWTAFAAARADDFGHGYTDAALVDPRARR